MKQISDIAGLEDALWNRPRNLSAALGVRAAARALPLSALWLEWDEEEAMPMVLPAFRVLYAPWLAAVERGQGGDHATPSEAPLAREVDAAIAHATGAVSRATSVVANTPGKAAFDHARNALAAAVRAAYPLGSATPGPQTVHRAMAHAADTADAWGPLREDLFAATTAAEGGFLRQWLLAAPLWPEGAPQWAEAGWNTMRERLRAREGELWHVWTDWYDALLDPAAAALPEGSSARARLDVPEALWRLGPKHANPEIASRLE